MSEHVPIIRGGFSMPDSGFQPTPHFAQLTTDALGILLLAAIVIVLAQMIRERRGR